VQQKSGEFFEELGCCFQLKQDFLENNSSRAKFFKGFSDSEKPKRGVSAHEANFFYKMH